MSLALALLGAVAFAFGGGFLAWASLKLVFRRGGVGPALPIFCLIAAGSAIAVWLTPRSFDFAEDVVQSPMATLTSQGATLLCLCFGVWASLVRLSRLTQSLKRPASYLWYAWMGLFTAENIVAGILGAQPNLPIASIYSAIVATAIYAFPPSRISQCVMATKASLALILYLSVAALAISPDQVVEARYEGLIPGIEGRFHGLTTHANILGFIAAFILIVEYGYPSARPWRYLNLLVGALVLFFAQSKTAWLAALVAIILQSIILRSHAEITPASGRSVHRPIVPRVLIILIPSLLLFGVVWLSSTGSLSSRADELSSFTGRTLIWKITYERFLDNPLFGYGPTLWGEEFRYRYGMVFAGQAHNQFMQTLGASGLVGAVGLVAYLVALGVAAFRMAGKSRGVSLALYSALLFHSFSEAPLRSTALLSPSGLMSMVVFCWMVCFVSQRQISHSRSAGDP